MSARKFRLLLATTLATLMFTIQLDGLFDVVYSADQSAGQKIIWKASFDGPPRTTMSQYTWFFDEMKKRTGGQFEVNVYWNSTLAPITQTLKGIRAGTFELGYSNPSYTQGQTPLCQFSYAPLIVPTVNHVNMWHWGYEFAQLPEIKQELAKLDAMVFLPFVSDQYMLMSAKPIRCTKDLAGLRIRDTPPSANIFERFGAKIVAIPPSETYEALQRNTLESVFMSGSGGKTFGYNEVCRYYIDNMGLKTGDFPLYCSKSKFEALPQRVKEVYYELLKESPAFSGALWDRLLREAYLAFDKNGLERIAWADEEHQKLLGAAKDVLFNDFIKPLEAKGLPARKVYDASVEISKKYGVKNLPTF